MDTLDKLGVGNVPLPAKNTRPVLVSDYNTLVDKVNEIILAISYISSLTPEYTLYTDPNTLFKFRVGIRNSVFVIDKELALGGFSDTEGIGWENLLTQA